MHLDHVTLPARDLDASVAFYRLMGFEQIVEAPGCATFKAPAGDARDVHRVAAATAVVDIAVNDAGRPIGLSILL